MKQSHITTPRTLAECSFKTGYVSAYPRSRATWLPAAITSAAMIVIGLLLAWRG